MKKFIKTTWGKAALVLILLQLVASVVFGASLVMLNLLPNTYLVIIFTAMMLLLILDFKLLFSRPKKRASDEKQPGKVAMYFKRIVGAILATVAIIGFPIGTYAVGLGITTIGDMFSDVVTIEETTSTFVLKDDPAQSLQDAANYTFGVTEALSWENTQESIKDINKTLGKEISMQKYDSVFTMVDALRNKEVGAILLNEAYLDVIKEVEGYEDFSEETRILHETKRTIERKVEEKENVTSKPFIVYISGNDTRSKKLTTSRSDVNIIVVVNPETRQIAMISTPRDSYVNTTVSGEEKDKLTHCGIYGIDCSIGTLENLYGIDITHYAQINFTGFVTLIDAIGGVDVYSERTTKTREGHFQLYEGMNHMSGEVALAFVRDRFNFPDGDIARSRHQMAVIKAVIDKASSASTIINNYSGILASLEGMFTTDFTADEFSKLAKMQLSDMKSWNIESYTIDGEGGRTYTYSMPGQKLFVMYMDEDSINHAKQLIQAVLAGESISSESSESGSEEKDGSGQDEDSLTIQ